jgi:hypothetical protein
MPAGMQCWDAFARLTVDLTTRLPRVLGTRSITQAGSLSDPNLSQGTPFYIFQQAGVFYHISGDTALPNFVISGNTISWSYSAASGSHHTNVPGTLFYGVY